MQDFELKQCAIDHLNVAQKEYAACINQLIYDAQNLLSFRLKSSMDVLDEAKKLIPVSQASYTLCPEFTQALTQLKYEFDKFNRQHNDFEQEALEANEQAKARGVTGIGATGLAPSAATALLMTFTSKSSKSILAALSSAAALNMALGWLFGGALATGGGWLVGGSSLLALFGPLGWAIGKEAILDSGFVAYEDTKNFVEKAHSAAKLIGKYNAASEKAVHEIGKLSAQTKTHYKQVMSILDSSNTKPVAVCATFEQRCTTAQQKEIAKHIHALVDLLGTKVPEHHE